MRVGVPKEIKNHEYRVGLTPASVAELIAAGHDVFVETKAGMGIDFSDASYEKCGAKILPTAADVFAQSYEVVQPPSEPTRLSTVDQIRTLPAGAELVADDGTTFLFRGDELYSVSEKWPVAAALAEIAGCFAFWAWLRLGRSVWWLAPGTASLILFACLLTLIDSSAAGRAFAAYGGVYICASLAWMWAVERVRPDRWDAIGALLCLAGAAVILLGPRS